MYPIFLGQFLKFGLSYKFGDTFSKFMENNPTKWFLIAGIKKNLNIVDNVYDDIKSSVKKSDLIILGVPVGAMKKIVTIIAPLLERGT